MSDGDAAGDNHSAADDLPDENGAAWAASAAENSPGVFEDESAADPPVVDPHGGAAAAESEVLDPPGVATPDTDGIVDPPAWEPLAADLPDSVDGASDPVDDFPPSVSFALGAVADIEELSWSAGLTPADVSAVWAGSMNVEQIDGYADPRLLGSAEPVDIPLDGAAG